MEAMVPNEMVLGLAGVPVIVALTEATKRVQPDLAPRYFPVAITQTALSGSTSRVVRSSRATTTRKSCPPG